MAYEKLQQEAVDWMGGECSHCKQQYPLAVYEFHHVDPSTKDREVNALFQMSKEKLYAELEKCILLCANCHRIEHHGV